MKNKKGFTLTEVLLAVMIVGLISISLAALTRSAARESGVGRSRIMLRNNLSTFMRTLRSDLMTASIVHECALCDTAGDQAEFSVENGATVPLLRLTKNQTHKGASINSQTPVSVMYCFEKGSDTTNIVPTTATRGGKIYRYEYEDTSLVPLCSEVIASGKMVLNSVKYIPSTEGYAVPMIGRRHFSRSGLNSMLRVNIITELNSTPVVNETVEETFAVPIGY